MNQDKEHSLNEYDINIINYYDEIYAKLNEIRNKLEEINQILVFLFPQFAHKTTIRPNFFQHNIQVSFIKRKVEELMMEIELYILNHEKVK